MFIKENHDLKRGGNRKPFELGRWQNSMQKKKKIPETWIQVSTLSIVLSLYVENQIIKYHGTHVLLIK